MTLSKLRFELDKVLEISKATSDRITSGTVSFVIMKDIDELYIKIGQKITTSITVDEIVNVFAHEDVLGKKQSLVIASSGGLCTYLPDGLVKLKEKV